MALVATIRRNIRRRLYRRDTWVRRGRAVRMMDMVRLLRLPLKACILDLGGTPYNWGLIEHAFRVTLVNLPARMGLTPAGTFDVDRTRFEIIEGDATNLKDIFADQSFDAVFSNSVIEHVGGETRQQMFADEARRIGLAYWIQTPSDRWLVEPHTGYPLQWQVRRLLGMDLVREGTRVLSRERMQQLLPDGQIYIERVLGMEKSYSLYKPYRSGRNSTANLPTR